MTVNPAVVEAPPVCSDDLDGDGGLDALCVVANALDSGEPGEMLIAISLRDGKRLWSRSIRSGVPRLEVTPLVGDFDGDERKTVVFIGMLSDTQADRNCEVRAFDGRDGALRWTWNPNAEFVLSSQTSAQMVVAKFAGRGKQNVCVRCLSRERTQWIVILDGGGTECTHREVAGAESLHAADVDGDGNDELLVQQDGRLYALDGSLKELWSWPAQVKRVSRIVAGSRGKPGSVILSHAAWSGRSNGTAALDRAGSGGVPGVWPNGADSA